MWDQLDIYQSVRLWDISILWSETLLRNIRWFKPICKLSPAKSKHDLWIMRENESDICIIMTLSIFALNSLPQVQLYKKVYCIHKYEQS